MTRELCRNTVLDRVQADKKVPVEGATVPVEQPARHKVPLVYRRHPSALAILAVAGSLRLTLIAPRWAGLKSDEATMGLAARHIAYHGEHPAFFYGQAYTSTIEAYLGALFFRLFGPSSFALRLGTVTLFLLFLVALYALASQVYDREVALMAIALLSLGLTSWRPLAPRGAIGGQTRAMKRPPTRESDEPPWRSVPWKSADHSERQGPNVHRRTCRA